MTQRLSKRLAAGAVAGLQAGASNAPIAAYQKFAYSAQFGIYQCKGTHV
jgi:hypothetical protein